MPGVMFQAGGLFDSHPISSLRLPSSSALVLCLRPRRPQPVNGSVDAREASEREGREKLAREMIENGQAVVGLGGGEGGSLGGVGGYGDGDEWAQLKVAQMTLEALEANLAEMVSTRERHEEALEVMGTDFDGFSKQ